MNTQAPQGYPGAGQRPAYPGGNPGGGYPGGGYSGQNRAPYMYPNAARPGHLGDWLNKHQGLSVQQQERALRDDPSFRQLPPGNQQRLMQQLRRLDQMPPARRQRTLARLEMLERLSPVEQMRINRSEAQYRQLPPDRKGLVKQAFQELSAVPLDQRQTVLNSARYRNMFTSQERGILSDLLKVEPYTPPR